MRRTYSASIKLALALFAVLTGWNVYRAATQAVTLPEAANYVRFIGPTWQESLRHFDTDNHVLNTMLVKVSCAWFHLTELTLRLPSLLWGLLYLAVVLRLCRRLLGDGWRQIPAVSVMLFNPLVFDALSEARGFGLAMAALLWAIELFVQCQEVFSPRKLNLAAACLAISVAASVAFIVPVAGLMIAATWLLRQPLARHLYLPFLVFAFVLLAIPLNHVQLTDLAQGSNSFRQSFPNLALRIAIPMVIVAGVGQAVRRRNQEAVLGLTSIAAASSVVLLYTAHARWRAPLPVEGVIYFVPLLTLLGLALVRRWPAAVVGACVPCLAIYAATIHFGAYRSAAGFEGSRELAKALRADAGRSRVRVAASPPADEIVNYYRERYGQANWSHVEPKPLTTGFDYYVLTMDDEHLVQDWKLTVLHRAPHLILARR